MCLLRPLAIGLLLSCGFGVQAGDNLSTASADGDLVKMQACVDAGEKATDVDRWGWTALHWAVYNNHLRAAEWLLERGAALNVKSVQKFGACPVGATPLILAAYYGQPRLVELFVKQGADRGVQDSKGMTAMDYAREFGWNECVELLKN
ncbi:ankyrin repeat domain-containing protein [Holophaga foetida]|uniref:ankyrin repeat domain-containing protein n=1 Tax=Holophaga foetida TaxID=35839 RepID=UPI00024717BB|nr:ankyrin repeat domain-containing protein [Holophaga foetida]